ncbi:hypothetical protein FGB62_193g043 [Gracilaria domingensis]|nr:hypothetical protein FGB62_193g043 [Gracilaria domingensis]
MFVAPPARAAFGDFMARRRVAAAEEPPAREAGRLPPAAVTRAAMTHTRARARKRSGASAVGALALAAGEAVRGRFQAYKM